MPRSFKPFLMFTGQCQEAIDFYRSVFPDSSVTRIAHYGPEAAEREGTVMLAEFKLGEQSFLAIDSPPAHDFTFTPSMSIFVECESVEELDTAIAKLAEGGTELMPVGDYGFSKRYGWVQDRFGVSWQLNLP